MEGRDFESEEEYAAYLLVLFLKEFVPLLDEGQAYETILEYVYSENWDPPGVVACAADIKAAEGEIPETLQ